jgi:hypothetical protein
MANHEVVASIRIALPGEPHNMAEELSTIAGAWAEFLGEIALGDGKGEATFSVNEMRTKPGPKPATVGAPRAPRARRGITEAQLAQHAAASDAATPEDF